MRWAYFESLQILPKMTNYYAFNEAEEQYDNYFKFVVTNEHYVMGCRG